MRSKQRYDRPKPEPRVVLIPKRVLRDILRAAALGEIGAVEEGTAQRAFRAAMERLRSLHDRMREGEKLRVEIKR